MHYEQFQDGTVKCIEDEIPFGIPDSWEWCRIQSIASVRGGKRIPKGYSVTDEKTAHAYIRVTDMKNNTVNLNDLKYISDEVYSKISSYTISKNDLYVTIAGTIGNVGEIPDELDGMNLTENAVKICNISINKAFLCKILSSELVQKQFRFQTHQVTMAKLALERILDTLIPLPPFNEQERIIASINKILRLIDKIECSKDSLVAEVDKFKSKILDLAIRGKLVPQDPNDEPASVLLERIKAEKEELIKQGKIKRDKKESVIFKGEDNSYYEKIGNDVTCIDDEIPFDIPPTWNWCRLGTIGDWAAGATPNRKNSEYFIGNIPWLKTGDLNDNYITYIPEHISEKALQHSSLRLNPTGSVLIAMYGATIGKLGILTFPATTNQACCACLPFDGIDNKYLFYYLMSQKSNFIYRGVGGAQSNISKEKIISTLFPLPPKEEQHMILSQIEKLMKLIQQFEELL